MQPFVIFLMLAAFAAACPPLFNDFTYLGNETHTTADLVRSLLDNSQTQTGWVEVVTKTGYPLQPWPAGRVMYCFDQPSTRQHYEKDLQEAWNMWSNLLGPAGDKSGHKLQFFAYIYTEDWWYCFQERKKDDDPWVWNPKVPYGVAIILEATGPTPDAYGPSAIVGFIPEDWPVGSPAAQMGLRLHQNEAGNYGTYQAWIAALAHELGHVFGLWHEHQRPDRDQYLWFNCPALPGYDAAKQKVVKEGKHTMEEVCASSIIAALYGFEMIKDYDTIDHLDPASPVNGQNWYWLQSWADRDYDENSIMRYDSHLAKWDHDEIMSGRLALWKYRGPDYMPPKTFTKDDLEICYVNYDPTASDIEGIKKIYAWSKP